MGKDIAPRRKYPGYWTVKAWRRGLRNRVSRWLGARAATEQDLTPIDPATIKRLIVCRRNRRLGNMLMLTPLLRSLSAALPQAEIDLLIGSADFAGLFRGLPGVRKVWVMPSRGWAWPWRMLRMLRHLRAQRYDLSLEPSFNSFSNRLSARLCGARFVVGFRTPDQWLRLTHSVKPDPAITHEALKPVQLVRDAIRGTPLIQSNLYIALSAEEREAARDRLRDIIGNARRPVIGFFTEATGRKRLPQEWWAQWAASLIAAQPGFQLLQVLPPGACTPLHADMASVCEPDHRQLAALLGHLDLFVSCDAGPMHLAGAAGTPTIGLFRSRKGERYGPLGRASLALQLGQQGPAETARLVARHLLAVLDRQEMELEASAPVRLARDLDAPAQPAANASHQIQAAPDSAAFTAPVVTIKNPR